MIFVGGFGAQLFFTFMFQWVYFGLSRMDNQLSYFTEFTLTIMREWYPFRGPNF